MPPTTSSCLGGASLAEEFGRARIRGKHDSGEFHCLGGGRSPDEKVAAERFWHVAAGNRRRGPAKHHPADNLPRWPGLHRVDFAQTHILPDVLLVRKAAKPASPASRHRSGAFGATTSTSPTCGATAASTPPIESSPRPSSRTGSPITYYWTRTWTATDSAGANVTSSAAAESDEKLVLVRLPPIFVLNPSHTARKYTYKSALSYPFGRTPRQFDRRIFLRRHLGVNK